MTYGVDDWLEAAYEDRYQSDMDQQAFDEQPDEEFDEDE